MKTATATTTNGIGQLKIVLALYASFPPLLLQCDLCKDRMKNALKWFCEGPIIQV
jgi:hypothetical protein